MTDLRTQPATFYFTPENEAKVADIIARYPVGKQQSAAVPLLQLAQKQCGNWLPRAAMDRIAAVLHMPPIRVYELATFYTMFNLQPVGRYLIQLCRAVPCWLRGGDKLMEVCVQKLGLRPGQTTADGLFSLVEVECLGACTCAPVAQINDTTYEDLTPESFARILDDLAAGRAPRAGSQSGRVGAEPRCDGGCHAR